MSVTRTRCWQGKYNGVLNVYAKSSSTGSRPIARQVHGMNTPVPSLSEKLVFTAGGRLHAVFTNQRTKQSRVNNNVTGTTGHVMGNGISHAQSPIKEKDGLIDDGHTGQFHKVLVEPDYCVPGPPTVSDDDAHNTSTLRIGTKPNQTNQDDSKPDKEVDDKTLKKVDAGFYSADVDYAVIEDENTELIPQSASSRLEQSEEHANATTDRNENTEIIVTQILNEEQNLTSPDDLESAQESGEKDHLPDISSRLSDESHLDKDVLEEANGKKKKESRKKESRSLLDMFKFSKHKPKVVAEFVPEVSSEKEEQCKKISSDDIQQTQAIVHSDLIDSLKETCVDGEGGIDLVVDNDKDVLIQKQPNDLVDNGGDIKSDIISGETNSSRDQTKEVSAELKIPVNVERVNSLDSGIVVDKISESSMNGQHVVQNGSVDIKVNDVKNQESENRNDKKKIEADNKGDEKVTDTKEEKTDTEMFKAERESGAHYLEELDSNKKAVELKSHESLDAIDQEERYSALGHDRAGKTVETGKSKKKSWSFQFGGSKKNLNQSENIDASTTSIDRVSSSEKKKSKSIWGKLSFRKSTDDVSMSTNADTFCKNEKSETKKKKKLKKLKAKKDKKGSLKKKVEETEEGERFSNADSHMSDELNTPKSRRSIVEEETPLVETDAFDGVSLSDLSLDGDVQVCPDPAGRESHDSPFDKELKTSLKKRAERLRSMSDGEQRTCSDVKSTGSTARVIEVNIKEPVENKNKETKDKKTTDNITITSVSAEGKGSGKKEKHAFGKAPPVTEDEYACIVKEVPGILAPLQQHNEYANLHVLPETEPVLEEMNESKIKSHNQQCTDGKEKSATELVAQKIEAKTNTGSVIPKNSIQNSESKESVGAKFGASLEKKGQEMPRKEDILISERNEGVSSAVKTEDKAYLNQGKLSPGQSNTQDDSDAYVHLVQLVQDYKDDKFDKRLSSGSEKLITGTNSVMINLVPVPKEAKSIDVPDNTDLKSKHVSPISETQKATKQKRGVIIMKEVGIQAPDIHIPMDIENEFGSNFRHGELVDVGVQVFHKDFDDCENKVGSPEISIPSAYF